MNSCLRQHQKWITIVLWAILVGCINGETSYRCYTCVSQNGDNTCLERPNDVVSGTVSVECDQPNGEFGWCVIVRQEYTEIPDQVVSFLRTCLKTEPPILDDVIVDAESTFYYRSCRSHLCNAGSGLESLDTRLGGGGSGANGGRGPIIVPGESGATLSCATRFLTFTMTFILVILFL